MEKSKCVHYSCKQNIILICPRQMNFVLAVPGIALPQLKGNSQNCDFLKIGISFSFHSFSIDSVALVPTYQASF